MPTQLTVNAPVDPDIVRRLQKELRTDAAVKARTRFDFPKFVPNPGKRRPLPTGWQKHQNHAH